MGGGRRRSSYPACSEKAKRGGRAGADPRLLGSAMPRRGTSKDAVAPLPQCPTDPFGRSQTPKDGGLRQPARRFNKESVKALLRRLVKRAFLRGENEFASARANRQFRRAVPPSCHRSAAHSRQRRWARPFQRFRFP